MTMFKCLSIKLLPRHWLIRNLHKCAFAHVYFIKWPVTVDSVETLLAKSQIHISLRHNWSNSRPSNHLTVLHHYSNRLLTIHDYHYKKHLKKKLHWNCIWLWALCLQDLSLKSFKEIPDSFFFLVLFCFFRHFISSHLSLLKS